MKKTLALVLAATALTALLCTSCKKGGIEADVIYSVEILNSGDNVPPYDDDEAIGDVVVFEAHKQQLSNASKPILYRAKAASVDDACQMAYGAMKDELRKYVGEATDCANEVKHEMEIGTGYLPTCDYILYSVTVSVICNYKEGERYIDIDKVSLGDFVVNKNRQ